MISAHPGKVSDSVVYIIDTSEDLVKSRNSETKFSISYVFILATRRALYNNPSSIRIDILAHEEVIDSANLIDTSEDFINHEKFRFYISVHYEVYNNPISARNDISHPARLLIVL